MLDKNELEEILNRLEKSDDDAKEMTCIYEDCEYYLKQIYQDGWIDEGKYAQNYLVFALMKGNIDTDIRISQCVCRTGNHWSGYDYEYYELVQVEEVEVTVKKWVSVR